ncbi:Slp family lipoprotein [Aerosticca soli]|jgi:outer membrane lipoprotein|uniref:Starvation lipoprotein Slp paralog n=1 Tax=Aerosticca soli TaxID=2010829 RepID=A0A2Z6E587_9GAMM|nr:Slp family lipoprotein [Aerosticca soli]MDI3261653.1 Slp family lipoprotein [Fulvimonas sp.]BBD79884.1 starvation lipoprotein Slp paralog [Aerosticca soli]
MRLAARLALIALSALALAACAPAPIYQPAPGTLTALPYQVAQTPERYAGGAVIWGGRVVKVDNLADHSEIEILAYPLDKSQRPKRNDSGAGRFIAVMRGYVEPLDYPPGALITVNGRLAGSRAGKVGEASYVFPLVEVAQSHVWTERELGQGGSNVHVGVGVGVIR